MLQGKVEMEVELLSSDECKDRPCGLGRDDPNEHPHLEPPKYVQTVASDIIIGWEG